MNKTIAFIFARGGSKGLPFKNRLLLSEHPLIAYSIYIAKINPLIDDVYVSTDSEEIAKIAIDYGAKTIIRPIELAQDNSPEFLSWKHAVNFLFEKGLYFEKFISLPPTSPLRCEKDIEVCLNELKLRYDSVVKWFDYFRRIIHNYMQQDFYPNFEFSDQFAIEWDEPQR